MILFLFLLPYRKKGGSPGREGENEITDPVVF